jgi:ferredoxin-NADP reductase
LTNVQIKVDVFSSQGGEMPNDPSNLLDSKWLDVTFYNYRIPNDYWSRTRDYDEVFICGPAEFGDVAQNRLKEAGIPDDRIHREGFY